MPHLTETGQPVFKWDYFVIKSSARLTGGALCLDLTLKCERIAPRFSVKGETRR